jgi:hypothetical protein
MCFSTGKPHPLASVPKFEMSVTGAAAHNLSNTEVIGDYILYWVGAPMYNRTHEGSLCTIYLIAWKEGWVSEVRLCPHPRPHLDISQNQNQPFFLSPLSFAPPAQACTARSYQ